MRDLRSLLEHIDTGTSRTRRSLEPVLAVARRLDLVPPAYRCVIVGGTNGKGSAAVVLESALRFSGARVGTTISPHLHRFHERVRLDGVEAGDALLQEALTQVIDASCGERLTYFDFATLAALVAFRRERVDFAILEVGLGGRLDAANVVDAELTLITNVAMDHKKVLGTTREAIGREKAGIFRESRTAVIGEASPPESVLEHAKQLHCPVLRFNREFSIRVLPQKQIELRLYAEGREHCLPHLDRPKTHPESYAAACQAAVCLMGVQVFPHLHSAAQARLPGRWEQRRYLGREWLLDGAHNPAAVRELARRILEQFPGRAVHGLFACRPDKDAVGMIEGIEQHLDTLAIAALDRESPSHFFDLCQRYPMIVTVPLGQAVQHLAHTSEQGDLIVVFGSFRLVARIREDMAGL